jgi:ribosomal protein S18 acetylase RimI-like enzyme
MSGHADIAALEERGFNAWPARLTVISGGWIFRLSDGQTKRANAASALCPSVPFAETLAEAEALYPRHDLPVLFRLSPLAGTDTDRLLAESGYDRLDPSLVLTVPLSGTAAPADVIVTPTPTESWLDGIARAEDLSVAARVLHAHRIAAVAKPAGFATVHCGNDPVGFGMAVHDRGMIGLFGLVVSPSARGHGAGRRLTAGLMQWGRASGATGAWLQVTEANHAARRLYTGLGFREIYRYHYRRRRISRVG